MRGRRCRAGASVAAALLLLTSGPSRATTVGIPDSDSATLLALLFQTVKDSAQIGQILTATEQSLETARYSLQALRSATEVVDEFRYLRNNPDEIFDAAASAFYTTFPELEAITREAAAIRQNLSGSSTGRINPFALRELFNNIAGASGSGYQTIIALDEAAYGLSREHMFTMEKLSDIRTQTEAIRRESMLALTPQGAAVITAKAAAQQAVVQSEAAAALAEILRIQKQQYVRGVDAASRSSAQVSLQATGLQSVGDIDDRLDPFRDDTRLSPSVDVP